MTPSFALSLPVIVGLLGCLPSPPSGTLPPMQIPPDVQPLVFHDPVNAMAIPYRLFVPDTCDAQHPCGVLLVLHGAGERGKDNTAQLRNHVLTFVRTEAQREFPTIVVFPQCPEGLQWVNADWTKGTYALERTPMSEPLSAVLRLLDTLLADYPIDPRRQLVTGLSMGGYGTWDLLARFPDRFAGAVALCGGGDPAHAAAMRSIPLWVFHGGSDPVVPPRGSRSMVKAIRAAGGDPRYVEPAAIGHDIWDTAYTNPDVARWLLSQRRK